VVAPLRSPQQPTPVLAHRLSVFKLSDAQVDTLGRAFAAIEAITDQRGFWHWAGLHGTPGYDCEHSVRQFDSLFLPWHRAYLYQLELALQTQVPGATLPWWDWPSSRSVGIPPVFAAAADVETENPLAGFDMPALPNAPDGWPSHTSRDPAPPAELPDQAAVDAVLALPHFDDFSLQLEQQLHNRVHVWTGGTMANVPTAAYDPIFWAHHTMVDRIWSLWQVRHSSPGPPPQAWRTQLRAVDMTVGDVLSTERLGYDYAASAASIAVGG
jgi:tyrosinase